MISPQSVFNFHIDGKNCHQDYQVGTWEVPTDLPYLQGHFPNQPILPAVAIADANLVFLEKTLNQPFKLKNITTAKFTAPVTPGLKVQLQATRKSENSWHCDWKEILPDQSVKNLAQMVLVLDSNI